MLLRRLFVSLVLTAPVFAATLAAAQSPGPELVFTPITPCRVFNTDAPGAGGRIRAKQTRTFQIAGTTGFDTQGGSANGCGVPWSATAVALQLSAINPAAAGHFTSFAAGDAKPDAESMVYSASISASSGVIAPLGGGRLDLFSRKGAGAMGTVTGYYAPQLAAHIGPNAEIFQRTSRVINVERQGLGGYRITFDRDVRGCVPIVVADNIHNQAQTYTTSESGWAQVTVRTIFTYDATSHINAPFRIVVHC